MATTSKWSVLLAVVCICLFGLSPAKSADTVEEEKAALEQSLNARAEALLTAPIGVFDVEANDGQIVRLKVKGEADVPTSLRGSRADRFAREKANRDARAAFVKFLGENVIFSESEGEGILIQEKDGQETSEVMNASAKLYSSNSAALLKGLIVLMDRIEGEGDRRSCTVVLGWSRKLVESADTARTDMTKNKNVEKDLPPVQTSVPEAQKKPAGNVETVTRIGNLDDF